MAQRTSNSAEAFERLHQAFSDVSFVSYDFDTIKQSLINYLKLYFPEQFQDYIESSEMIAILEMFAYIAEQLAYRVDMVSHENFISTAQRKQSILRLAKLISYKTTRNIPVRGLVKLTSISTTERIIDSRGIDLSGLIITWNDPNNLNWKEQFILIANHILGSRFGEPQKTFQVGDVVMDLYSLKNNPEGLRNGVFAFSASAGLDNYPMELVPIDLDENGPFEREPDLIAPLNLIYANDGIGDGSDYSGFLAFIKQGTLVRVDYNLSEQEPDRRIDFDLVNVNQTDVWVQRIEDGVITERWIEVDTTSEQNLVFNDLRETRQKFEVDTRENDKVTVIFGNGDFSDAPIGIFRFWFRQSANQSIIIQKNKIQNQAFSFLYTASHGNTETCNITFSLTSTLQNGSASESIEHIRRAAPSTFYSQNRMVNGQDYNTFLLRDPSILRVKTINRTFAGQPKYIDWNDASGMYENIKLFGDDAILKYELSLSSQTTSVSGQALIDSVIEPLLNSSGVINTLLHLSATDPATIGVVSPPRRRFIEDNRGGLYFDKNGNPVALISSSVSDGSLKEKTAIQGLIDRHWYGEPVEFIQEDHGTVLAKILDPDLYPTDDSKIYAAAVPRTIDGVSKYPPGDVGSGLQPIAEQDYFALRYNRYTKGFGNGMISILGRPANSIQGEVWTIEVNTDGQSLYVRSNLRGTFPTGSIGNTYNIEPSGTQVSTPFFIISEGSVALAPGDAFILDTPSSGFPTQRGVILNLNGWWEILGYSQLPDYASGIDEAKHHELKFTTDDSSSNIKQHTWIIFIRKLRQQPTNNIIGYEVHHRDIHLTIQSPNTNFWYNSTEQLLDNETNNRVFDNIKILGSNFDSNDVQLKKSQKYDVVNAVKNMNGVINSHSLEIMPTDLLQEDDSGDLISDRLLQFETFSKDSYEYFLLDAKTVLLQNEPTTTWAPGAFVDSSLLYGRQQRMPRIDSDFSGLDFMWQHFTPYTNIIDPSVTNIHDAYIMTRGYYDNIMNFIHGTLINAPTPPSPLELLNSYGYLLQNKMLSDTVVLHPGKLRLLFGSLAEPELRAKFKVVRSQNGTLTNERIKEEILNVINLAFDIDNWDFGDIFYATKLITLIHQRLPVDIASVVLVPMYSTNSFGSLFTVEPGFDEILQSAATLSDIEVVQALTPSVIRQSK